MGIYLAFTLGMGLWVALWSVGVKALDGFMLFLLILLGAAIAHIVGPHLPGRRAGD